MHRNASLLAVVFLCIHIGTTLLDSYVPIRVINVFVPFGSAYKPLWLGFGAIAFDLLMAVAITSASGAGSVTRCGGRRIGLHMRRGRSP